MQDQEAKGGFFNLKKLKKSPPRDHTIVKTNQSKIEAFEKSGYGVVFAL